MKYLWTFVVAAVLALHPACAFARETVTLWMWGAPPNLREALRKALVEPFEGSQSHYSLHIEYRNTVDSDVRTALMAGRGPDIVYTSGPSALTPLIKANRILPLDGYERRYRWNDRLLPQVLSVCQRDGHLYCMPPTLEVDGMVVNKRTLARHGWHAPTDGAALIATMRAAQRAGLYASVGGNKGWQPVNENYASIFLNQMVAPDQMRAILEGRRGWSGKDTEAALAMSRAWYKAGFFGGKNYFSINFDQSMQLIHDGRTPFFFGPILFLQWAPGYYGAAEDELDFLPFPRMKASQPYPLYDIGVATTLSVNADSPVKDGAAAVLNTIMSAGFMERVTQAWPGYWNIPLRRPPSMANTTGVAKTYLAVTRKINAAIAAGRYGFKLQTFAPPATYDVFVKDLEAVWLDLETPKDMLGRVDAAFQRERARGLVLRLPPAAPTKSPTGDQK